MKSQKFLRHPPRLLISFAFILFLIWLVVKAARIQSALQSLASTEAEINTMLAEGATPLNPDDLEKIALDIRRDVLRLQSETKILIPILPYLDWVPRYGATLSVGPHLLEMADAGSEAAVIGINKFKPMLTAYQNGDGIEMLPLLIRLIQENEPELVKLNQAMNRLLAAREKVGPVEGLSWRVSTLLKRVDPLLPLAKNGLVIAPHLPDMLGGSGGRRYLILAQNEDELRPTGGFISGAGLLEIKNGRIQQLSFQDSYLVDNWQAKPYDYPPQPLYDHMGLELFLFRDANYWPDFPTSAEQAMALYSYGQDLPPLDGAIAIDQRFLQHLIQVTGPIKIPDSQLTINGTNVVETMQTAWSLEEGQTIADWTFSRKDFMNLFATAILNRFESDFSSINPVDMFKSMVAALEEKSLQLYFRDPGLAISMNDLGWDGRLPAPPEHDFLMVVDTNVGYTKANAVIKKSINYKVQLSADGPGTADLEIIYQHNGQANGETCQHGIVYDLETIQDYRTLTNKCYWNYQRIYVPPGSELLSSTRQIIPAENLINGRLWDNQAQLTNEINGLTTLSNLMLVKQGQTKASQYSYSLPKSIVAIDHDRNQYQLVIYKQAGTDSEQVNLIVVLPDKSTFDGSSPLPLKIDGTTLHYSFDLDKDTRVVVNYR